RAPLFRHHHASRDATGWPLKARMAGTAKFLFTVWPFAGHVAPNVAIAPALAGRGHETAFYTGASIAASLEGEGFRCFPFRQVDEARVEAIVLALDAASLQWWRA